MLARIGGAVNQGDFTKYHPGMCDGEQERLRNGLGGNGDLNAHTPGAEDIHLPSRTRLRKHFTTSRIRRSLQQEAMAPVTCLQLFFILTGSMLF